MFQQEERWDVENSQLVYWPDARKENKKFVLKGRWDFSREHQLKYVLSGLKDLSEDIPRTITFDTELLDANEQGLTFSLSRHVSSTRRRTWIVTFGGAWRLDRYNRLRFVFTRNDGAQDQFRFDATWSLNEHQEMVYSYKNFAHRKTVLSFTLKGRWRIVNDKILAYQWSKDSEQNLAVRVAYQTEQIRAKKGVLRFRYGIGFRKNSRKEQEISFFGEWKVSRDLAVSFEMKDGVRKKTYTFAIETGHFQKAKVGLELRYADKDDWRIKLNVAPSFFKDGKAFMAWQRDVQTKMLSAGLSFAF